MIQFNMATGEIITSEFVTSCNDQQPAYEIPHTELQLQPHLFETAEERSMPADLVMVDAALFISAQIK